MGTRKRKNKNKRKRERGRERKERGKEKEQEEDEMERKKGTTPLLLSALCSLSSLSSCFSSPFSSSIVLNQKKKKLFFFLLSFFFLSFLGKTFLGRKYQMERKKEKRDRLFSSFSLFRSLYRYLFPPSSLPNRIENLQQEA